MDLISPKIIKELLSKYKTRPSKGLGQNFLIDKNILEKIIVAADIKPTDTILEVGPGIGTLTQEIAKRAEKVIAVEKDKTMIEVLKKTLKDFDNVEVIQGDALSLDVIPAKAGIQDFVYGPWIPNQVGNDTEDYKIVANIPYYLTSPLIRKFLESDNPPSEMILMLQKEVAQRICSKPPDMNLLAVSVQFYADPKIISYVSKNCFWPSPKVDSAIIKIIPYPDSSSRAKRSNLFFEVVKAGFSQPRKQLAGNLSKILKLDKEKINEWLSKNKIAPTRRAETLSVSDWQNLTNSVIL